MLNRRDLLIATLASGIAAPAFAAAPLDAIEATLAGGRLGVFAIDLATRRTLSHRADERFAMCSTFKVPLVAAVLARIDAGELRGEQRVAVTAADLLDYAPRVRAALPAGAMSVFQLCAAAVEVSDNAAANLLLHLLGGPPAVTRYTRACGDRVTRLDRTEPSLNTNLPGEPRDTTTPRAMAGLLRTVLVGSALSPASRAGLVGWMVACETGRERLRAGLPAGWQVGDKTGSGGRGAVNDVAIAWPAPDRAPVLIASYIDAPAARPDVANAAHVAVARLVAATIR